MPHSDKKPKSLCFVVGPIGKDGTEDRKHSDLLLFSVVKHVLESDQFGYQVKRADEDADPGMIGDRVVSDLINAELVVADLTGLNPNAFYELGIRHSTQKPTIHIAKTGTSLPFDNISHRTIFVDLMDWHSTERARTQLAESAKAIKEPTFKVSNPITQANATFQMRASADPKDNLIAEMNERLAALENSVLNRVGPITSVKLSPNRNAVYDLGDEIKRLYRRKIPKEKVIEIGMQLAKDMGIEISRLEIEEDRNRFFIDTPDVKYGSLLR